MQIIIPSVLLMLFVAVCIDAQRGGRGRGRGPMGRRSGGGSRLPIPALKDAEMYTWDVDASAGTLIPQKGFVIPDKDTIAIVTFSKDLRDLNMSSSAILMNTATQTMTIRGGGRRSPCFMTNFSANKLEIESDSMAWNDTTITMAYNVALNGTKPALTRTEALAKFQADPSLARFCRAARLVETTPMLAGGEDIGTKTIMLLGYNTHISIMVPENPISNRLPGGRDETKGQRRGQGRGQGRRQGGRRGRGQRNGQDQDQGQDQTLPRGPFGRGRSQGGRGRGDRGFNL